MKTTKFVSLLLCGLLLITTLFSLTGCNTTPEAPAVAAIYVSAAGNNENDGLTAETSVATLEKAVELATANPGAKVVLQGEWQVDTLPAHTAPLTFTGNGKGTLLFTQSLNLNGPTTFESMGLGAAADCYLNTEANALTVSGDVTAAGEGVLSLHVGARDADCGKTYAYIGGGAFGTVFVGNFHNTANHTMAGSYVELQGGTVSSLIYGAHWDGTNRYRTDFTEPVTLVIGGAVIQETFEFTTYQLVPVFRKGFQLIHNNGTAGHITLQKPVVTCALDNQAWILNGESSEGCYVTPTEVNGTFTVHGDMEAMALDESDWTTEYRSVNGVLTVPPGTYTVMYDRSFETEYANFGDRILAYEDCTLTLADQPYTEKEGMAFLGWVDKDGAAVTNQVSLKAGDTLTASYVAYTAADLTTPAASLTEKDGVPALQFTFSRSDALLQQLPAKAAVFGGLWIPSLVLNSNQWAPLTYGTEYPVGEEVATPTDVLATTKDHTVTIPVATPAEYNTLYTVRGYLCYTDLNGNDRYCYSAEASTTLYAQAKAASPKTEQTEALVAAAKQAAKEAFDETRLPEDIKAGPNASTYQLEESGIVVREHVFDVGLEGETVEIVQLSDLHYNYLNQADILENNPALISTRNYRSWLYNGSSAKTVRASLQYAASADQVILTGDVLDYLSRGALEITRKEVWNLYPDALICNGNHDYVQVMQGKLGEILSVQERYDWLQREWNHDVLYTSRVLKDKVMVIQLDNGQNQLLEGQNEKLEADLAVAREKGYTVLLFMHIPLAEEKNSTVAAVKARYNTITQNGDIIKGIFTGHAHGDYYAEISATTPDGTATVIPNYTMTATAYGKGNVTKIIVK